MFVGDVGNVTLSPTFFSKFIFPLIILLYLIIVCIY